MKGISGCLERKSAMKFHTIYILATPPQTQKNSNSQFSFSCAFIFPFIQFPRFHHRTGTLVDSVTISAFTPTNRPSSTASVRRTWTMRGISIVHHCKTPTIVCCKSNAKRQLMCRKGIKVTNADFVRTWKMVERLRFGK